MELNQVLMKPEHLNNSASCPFRDCLKKNKTTKKTKISIDVHQYGINIDFLTDFCLKNKLTQSNVSSDQD